VIPNDKVKQYRSTYQTYHDPIYNDNYYKLGDCRSIIKTYGKKVNFPENQPFEI